MLHQNFNTKVVFDFRSESEKKGESESTFKISDNVWAEKPWTISSDVIRGKGRSIIHKLPDL